MITDDRINVLRQYVYDEFLVDNIDVKYRICEDIYLALGELKTLHKSIKQQGSILDSREELIIKLIKDGDKMAQILSDGEGKEDEICCVDYFHARDAVYKHAELTETK